MYPTTFPPANTHRVVHFLPEHRPTDFARIEDIAADAILHARMALSLQSGLYTDAYNTLAAPMMRMTAHVVARRLLTDDARAALGDIVSQCEHLLQSNGDDTVLEAIQLQAQTALDASNRVADLLAAEVSVGRFRGIPASQG